MEEVWEGFDSVWEAIRRIRLVQQSLDARLAALEAVQQAQAQPEQPQRAEQLVAVRP